MKATLTRNSRETTQTTGRLDATDGNNIHLSLATIELPWLQNQSMISCIPIGSYECRYTKSARFSEMHGEDVFTYEVLAVLDRAGIRIHACNFSNLLKGCIGLGLTFADINSDGIMDITSSREAIQKFEDFMKRNPFILEVINSKIIA